MCKIADIHIIALSQYVVQVDVDQAADRTAHVLTGYGTNTNISVLLTICYRRACYISNTTLRGVFHRDQMRVVAACQLMHAAATPTRLQVFKRLTLR